ncbi:hypothetical protein KSE_51690 [Kitasatospora setae KM-6054]|uniref:TPM domain-containing protein n=1 Tax=Kitasatospora setae (strain ATCC 33774 / DSM 43861 / JCM 3304 / KCC A-0304 / NBRC 14216 / KM-6054) TaxID=452652 RepID=E4NHG8_KITSK|nr:hypothetical protein KSE_51690 [Kitasatospora setae KM-6054]
MLRRSRTTRTGPAAVLAALLGLLLVVFGLAAPASASGLNDAADAMKKVQLYVDPAMSGRFSKDQADRLAEKLKDADKPIFVAVLPDSEAYPARTVIKDLRTKVGIVGVYAVWRGDRFAADSDSEALGRAATDNLAGAAYRSNGQDIGATLTEFVDGAARQAKGEGPQHSDSIAWVLVPVLLLVLAGGGALLLFRRAKKRKEAQARAELAQLRTVVDEDITAFGEELDRLDFDPGAPDADDAQRADYTGALDAYDRAKRMMDAAERPEDVRPVTEALEQGRFALAVLAARREGRPLPERRVPCFFDPRHGPSSTDVDWAPQGGATRSVPACAADAARIADGRDPDVRTVRTEHGDQPYWNAGPAYSPWAGGYFGGGLLPGLLVGTVLGSVIATPAYAYGGDGGSDGGGHDYTGGADAGDYSGGDFNPADFGDSFDGGGFDGGGFGGGDFGGFGD